ncbi:non-proteolytic archaemetzincin-like protein [Archangium violaceum]|jgi:archaemetzincin|uniref:non-proteolytic archaemetzincin-like protein n=1 Tax=Archangium violaceum TaxID=83451 RepID=UPI00194DF74B|nr:non-proteolytic archaemetzincin-like protein [Archangium violaceum]QRN96872.1 non-proteolytic archaemetzincin-like protein [Archangium violaceum]
MTQPQKVLLLVSVGHPPPVLLREVEEPISLQLGLATVVSKTALPTPTYAFNKDRGQYHCNAIMRRLVTLLEPGHSMVLGVTDVDLFVPDSPFVLGEADRESKSAVLSLARLRQGADGELLRRRLQVEAVHQAGHLLGLSYCEDPRCVMFFAQSQQDCDRKQQSLCNNCRNELNKLNR